MLTWNFSGGPSDSTSTFFKMASEYANFPMIMTFMQLLLVFTTCKAEQPLRGMELQEKEAQKG